MKETRTHRLPYDDDKLFSGALIDRGRPVRIQLDGRTYRGFEGDSVLSCILASGVDTMGEINEAALALDPGICPPVVYRSGKQDTGSALPMDRTPAVDGMDLVSFNARQGKSQHSVSPVKGFMQRLLKKTNPNLGFDFSGDFALSRPWNEAAPDTSTSFDLVVVGGGVAGLNAAQSALANGFRVALVERQRLLGGDAQFFGATEGEKRPGEFVEALAKPLRQHENLEIFTNCEVVSVSETGARGHQIVVKSGVVTSRIIEFQTEKTVLATGTLERLPIFPGNRIPGVIGARTAFQLAWQYGIWRGKTAALCTSSSEATRVALLAADLGIDVVRLADSRINPKSRFFEFAKAYGISLATGSQIVHANTRSNGDVCAQFGLMADSNKLVGDPLDVDRLVVCGGWQPNLSLWHGAGGRTDWSAQSQQLLANGSVEHIELAGACLGAMGMSECVRSGDVAVRKLCGQDIQSPAHSARYDQYESVDGDLPIAFSNLAQPGCYLDNGYSLATPQVKTKTRFWRKMFVGASRSEPDISYVTKGYSLNDVVAKVILKEIPPDYAGIFAQERCGLSVELIGKKTRKEENIGGQQKSDDVQQIEGAHGKLPDYLAGRFGPMARVHEVVATNDDPLEIGCLIYHDFEAHNPSQAIGCVFCVKGSPDSKNFAYVGFSKQMETSSVVIHSGSHLISATII